MDDDLCVIFARVFVCVVPGSVPLCVDISVKCFIVFILSFMCRYAHSGYNVIIYGHYIDSTLVLCTHIVGRFFAREYLYIG